MSAPPRRRPPSSFQPRFTLGLLYLVVFFFLFCFLLIAPALIEVLRTVPVGPEQEEAARRVAQETVRPRLWIALAAAVLAVGLGGYTGVLPGLKPHVR